MERIPVEKLPDFLDHLQHTYGESGTNIQVTHRYNFIREYDIILSLFKIIFSLEERNAI